MKHISKRNQNAVVRASLQVTRVPVLKAMDSWERITVHLEHTLASHSP